MAAPAEPILASTLYNAHLAQHFSHESNPGGSDNRRKRRRLLSGSQSVDQVLGEGLVYGDGGVCCISGENDAGARGVSQHLLISHLTSDSNATASIIDTQGNLNILSLYNLVLERLSRPRPHQHQTARDGEESEQTLQARATGVLDRLKILRVFDFEGMLDSIAEVRDGLEHRGKVLEKQSEVDAGEGAAKVDPRPRTMIPDSQFVNEDDQDMLLDLYGEGEDGGGGEQDPVVPVADLEPNVKTHDEFGMLVIDDLTSVMAPLMRNNRAQGQSLLALTLRTLTHLTRSHSLCTILLNSTVTYKNDLDTPSIFSSTTSRPALGKAFLHLLDLHLFVSLVPKAAKDAASVYGRSTQQTQMDGRGSGGPIAKTKAEWVSAVEVLSDRYEGRVGRFGCFVVPDKGLLRDAFPVFK